MSFLTPLYIAGLLAVSLPVVFHLIRRRPAERVLFSTLMFLEPSPPRFTRRSRLENWPLLLLRALAVCLLALAFARPFLRHENSIGIDRRPAQYAAVLLDTSASMRRAKLWDDALAQARSALAQFGNNDRVAAYTFDRELRPLVDFDDWGALEPPNRAKLVGEKLAKAAPGWGATDLGGALIATVDALRSRMQRDGQARRPPSATVVLISDLQAGARLDRLENYAWPRDVNLLLRPVAAKTTTNAGLHVVAESPDPSSPETPRFVRAMVFNAADSSRQKFRIRWADSKGTGVIEAPDVYVPAGSSRAVRVPVPASLRSATQLVLEGDDHDFDNVAYVVPRAKRDFTIVFFGRGETDDPKHLRYYLQRAFPETTHRKVEILTGDAGAPAVSSVHAEVHLVIVAQPLSDEQVEPLQRYARNGGTVLVVAGSERTAWEFGRLLGRADLDVREADVDNYAMLGDVDFSHPVFEPFRDARFSDFTKLHFWKYRRLDGKLVGDCKLLARFDATDAALLEKPLDAGRVLLLASGWHPRDSELARSSKFVPLLNSLLEYAARKRQGTTRCTVGDAILISSVTQPSLHTAARGLRPPQPSVSPGRTPGSSATAAATAVRPKLRLPDNRVVRLASEQKTFDATVVPGVYEIVTSAETTHVAVNLAPEESKTSPLPLERLESLGVRLEDRDLSSSESDARRTRQLRRQELENRQKLWRWLMLAALGVLGIETWLAGRTAVRQLASERDNP